MIQLTYQSLWGGSDDDRQTETLGQENLLANPFVRRLSEFTRLSVSDRIKIDAITRRRLRQLRPQEDIVREGERPRVYNLLMSGWGARYKSFEDGRRQILSFFIPGDLCDLNMFVLRTLDHSICALTACSVAEIGREEFDGLLLSHPRLSQALTWQAMVNQAIQREWILNLGQRTALERLSYLLCELFVRLRGLGMVDENRCGFPLTQTDLADASGLTPVHVNRTLQELRRAGLIILQHRELTIPNVTALMQVALFNANYLHLGGEGHHLDANE